MKKLLGFILLSCVVVSGCSLLQEEKGFSPEQSATIGEALLPQDVLFLAKWTTEDESQFKHFKELEKTIFTFPAEFREEFWSEINQTLSEFELDYLRDIKPMLAEKSETIVALGGDFSQGNPDFFCVQKIADSAKYDEITQLLSEQNVLISLEQGFRSQESYDTPEDTEEFLYIGHKNNFVFLTNRESRFQDMYSQELSDSLVYSENYIETRENLPSSFLGVLYINFDLFSKQFQALLASEEAGLSPEALQAFDSPWLSILSGMGFTLNAEEGALRLAGHMQGNTSAMQKLDFHFNYSPNAETYLDHVLPGKKVYLYTESFNLKQRLEKLEESLAAENPENYELYLKQMQQVKTFTGIDFKEDILSWLDKAFAFSLQDTGSILPGLTIAVDVSSNPEGAGKLLDTIDSFTSIALLSLKQYSQAILRENVALGESELVQFSVATENLPLDVQEGAAELLPLLDTLKITYGLTPEHTLVFTTYPEFLNEYQKDVLADNAFYSLLKEKVENTGQGVFYLSPETLALYLENIQNTLSEFSGLSPSDEDDLQSVISYLKSLRGFIFTDIAHEESMETQGYLQVNL